MPGVVDVASFGGVTREYQVILDPEKLIQYGLTVAQVKAQLIANNVNAGGSFIETGQQQINIREVGLFKNVNDIAQTVLKSQNGTALRVSDVANVVQGPKIRLGQIGKTIRRKDGKYDDNPDAVEGVLLLQKGDNSDETLEAIHAKVKELNEHVLPKGVKVVPFLDRSDLLHLTTHTVLHNLTEGIILVVIILFVFLGNLRGALIVAVDDSLCSALRVDLPRPAAHPGEPAVARRARFGMVVDGAVVMVENIVRHLSHGRREDMTPMQQIREAAYDVQRPVVLCHRHHHHRLSADALTLQSVEGPAVQADVVDRGLRSAWGADLLDHSGACAGQLSLSQGDVGVGESVLRYITNGYRHSAQWAIEHRPVTFGVAIAAFAATVYLGTSGVVGSEFLPHLDEGAIWVRGTLAPSTGRPKAARSPTMRVLCSLRFPR